MKKLAFAVMTTAAVLSFAGCSKDNGSGNNDVTPTPVESQEGTEVTPEAGTEGEVSSDAEYEKLVSYRDAVKEAFGENYIPSMEYSQDEIKELFGLTPDMYDAILAEGPMMSVHVDTFIAVRPSEGNLDAVVTALEAYRDGKISNTMQYPMNLSKLQACRVETMGDYVFLLMVGTTNEMFETEEEFVEAFAGFNQQAVDVIQETMDNE